VTPDGVPTRDETVAPARSWARPDLRYDEKGLVPAIVQDPVDGRVLMLAWMDAEALDATLATGEVHFHSRSRDRLWRKGETSGNVLRLVDLTTDCDSDALLVTAEPIGPTCHRGTPSCFDPDEAPPERSTKGFAWFETLWATIASRAASRPEGSYTARLLDGGVDAVARKVTEEATEVLMAAKDDAAAEANRAIGTHGATGTHGAIAAASAIGAVSAVGPAGAASAIGATGADRAHTRGADRADTRAALAGETADLLYHTLVLLAERGVDPASVVKILRERHGG